MHLTGKYVSFLKTGWKTGVRSCDSEILGFHGIHIPPLMPMDDMDPVLLK